MRIDQLVQSSALPAIVVTPTGEDEIELEIFEQSAAESSFPKPIDLFSTKTEEPSGFFGWLLSIFGAKTKAELTSEQKAKIEALLKEMKEAKQALMELENEPEEEVPFEFALLQYHKAALKLLADQFVLHTEGLKKEQCIIQKVEEQRFKEHDRQAIGAKFAHFFSGLSTLALPVQALAVGLSLPPGVNVAVGIIALVITLDKLTGNGVTGSFAHLISRGDNESKESWAKRLIILSDLLALSVSLGINQGAALEKALGVIAFGTEGGEAIARINSSITEGKLTQLDGTLNELLNRQESLLKNLTNVSRKEVDHQSTISSIQRREEQHIREALQGLANLGEKS
jgi:hypothetical protein